MNVSSNKNKILVKGDKICFVISPIGKERSDDYIHFKEVLDYLIKPAINESGYDLKVIRADEIEKPGSITKDILDYLANSYVVIADLTNQNPNVFYELGIRHALCPRTILIAQSMDFVPFDLQEYRIIVYDISAKGAAKFKNRLSKFLEEINNNPSEPDNPVLEKIGGLAKKKLYELDKHNVLKRRSLSYAMEGIPHLTVIESVANHLANPNPEYESILELPSTLSSVLELRCAFIFRQNATQAYRDALEVSFFHEIVHKSRPGEEGADVARVLMHKRDPFSINVGNIIYSDVEHPALDYISRQIWPKELILPEVSLTELMFNSEKDINTEIILDRYIIRIKNENVSVIVIPHVIWFNGAVLDVQRICKEIKSISPLITTIVDGAQAVGNIPLNIEQVDKENSDIDFYIGCGHKWICGPETVGFARVSRRYSQKCEQCQQFLVTSDQLTDSSTLSLLYQGQQIGANQRGLAKGLLQALKYLQKREGGINKVYFDIQQNANNIREIISKYDVLKPLDPPENMRSGIISFTTNKKDQKLLKLLKSKLDKERFSTVVYELPFNTNSDSIGPLFCRLSPGPDLTNLDIERISAIFEEVLLK